MKYCYDYPRPAVTVDAVVFRKSESQCQILLIKRKYPPFQFAWCLPGGFVDMNETLEEAVKRELEEETGLVGIHMEQVGSFSAVNRDPRGRTITIAFKGICEADFAVRGADDASEAVWWNVEELPELGFDHAEIIQQAMKEEIN